MSTRRMILAGLLGIGIFLGVWEAYVQLFDVQRFILLPPSAIVGEILELPRFYLEASLSTAWHAAVGMILALIVAILIGSALTAWRFVDQATQPVLVGILVAPWIAYFTSIVLWLGPGWRPVVFLVAFVTMPAFVFATVAGMRGADPAAREVFASVQATRREVLWRLRLPSALPSILAAARYNIGLALAAAYYGEGGNQSNAGLGAAGRRALSTNADVLWATILCTAALGAVFLGILSLIERLVLRWHVSQRSRASTRHA